MHLRHADSSSVRPRGKKLGVADPDLGVDVAATRARPGNCTPASPPPHGDGSPATAVPDTDPNPTPLWPPHGTARPSDAGARIPPSPTAAPVARSCSGTISRAPAGPAPDAPRSTSLGAADRRSSPANTAARRNARAATPGSPAAKSPSPPSNPAGPPGPHRPVGPAPRASRGPRGNRSGPRPHG